MTLEGDDRSPFRYYGRSTFEPQFSDRNLLPKPDQLMPSYEHMPYGGRERGGASGGELHPAGPGPFPNDLFSATDITKLPWTRARGDEWTTAEFRLVVFGFIRDFFRVHAGIGLIAWDVTEKATSDRSGSVRLEPQYQYLRIGITRRLAEDKTIRVECSQAFPFNTRVGAAILNQLAPVKTSLEVALAIG